MTTTALNSRIAATHGGPSFWQRVWAALEAHGQRRAAAELQRIAILHVSTDPELSRNLRAIATQSARG